jgi:hypothetical protein
LLFSGLQLLGYQNTTKSMILDVGLDSSLLRRQPQQQMTHHPSRLTSIPFQMCIGARLSSATTHAGLMAG